MQVSFSATDIDDLFTEWHQKTGASLKEDSVETILELSPLFGNGCLRRIKLRPGLEITIEYFEFLEPFIAEVSNHFNREGIEFKSSLSGYTKGTLEGLQDEYYLKPRQSRVSCSHNCGERIECQPHQPIIHVEVIAEISTLNKLIAGQADQISLDLQNILDGRVDHPLSWTKAMSHVVFQAAEQILNCPYQGLTRRLYLESRALELIALQLPLRSSEDELKPSHSILKADEIDRIHYAKEILLNNLENPPSLIELARQVGLNDYKLKRGFRQVFGTTAFGCLYHHRMEQARKLLEENCSTVMKVAQAVGYTSSTSFSAAFKKKFGVPPKNYKLR